jgi:hypothetical protein
MQGGIFLLPGSQRASPVSQPAPRGPRWVYQALDCRLLHPKKAKRRQGWRRKGFWAKLICALCRKISA